MLAGIVGKMGGSLGALGGDLLGMKTSGDLFATVLTSRTVQDDLVNKFDLRRIYGVKRWVDARKELTSRTDISIDHKSGVLTIHVQDHDPQRARAIAQEYVAQLNNVVTQLNTSSAHREREFLEGRLEQVKVELESAEKEFSQFASSNATIDIKEQGKAMVEAAAALEGELIATETELQGLRQIYTDYNVRVRTAQARVKRIESADSETWRETWIRSDGRRRRTRRRALSVDPEASAAGSDVRGSVPKNKGGRDASSKYSRSNTSWQKSRKPKRFQAQKFWTRRTFPRKKCFRRGRY